jgi:hypothetical protein
MNREISGLIRVCVLATAFVISCLAPQSANAQFVQRAVGGIAVDADGVLSAPTELDQQNLIALRREMAKQAPADLQKWTDLRAVSLKQLESKLAEARRTGQPIPEEVLFLAGLQRVQFIFVYPEEGDVVLAGPAEGWRIDALGNVVGVTSGRPVLLLDDLMVALRTRNVAQLEAISCSIDPTPEGIKRLQAFTRRQRGAGSLDNTLRSMEEALGQQVVSVTGVPASSHFARTMVAADFRMKRLAMGMEAAPVDGMPSFLTLLQSGRGNPNMAPRWWLAPNYLPLAKDEKGLAWELRGQGVKCMTEQDYLDSNGQRVGSGKAGAAAKRWAQTFTDRFQDLADQDSSFAKLRNVMDLAVVAALIDQERLLDQVGLKLPELFQEQQILRYDAPRQVASQATFVRRRGDVLISTSGGVQLLPWEVAKESVLSADVAKVREQLAASGEKWYRQ